MAEWDIEPDSDLIDGVKRLAARHYEEVSDASIARVTEVALEMCLLWQKLVKGVRVKSRKLLSTGSL